MVVGIKPTCTNYGSPISGSGFFFRVEYPNMVMTMSRIPSTITQPDTLAHRHIIKIHDPSRCAKIDPSIVGAVTIYMIDLFWNRSSHPQKGQAVSVPMAAFDTDTLVAVAAGKPGLFSRELPTTGHNFPKKLAGLWVVIQNLLECFLFHATTLAVSPCGRNRYT